MRTGRYILLYWLIHLFLPVHSQLNTYHYKRKINGISSTWHKLSLPDDIFCKLSSRNYADLRIYGITHNSQDTIEAPYMLEIRGNVKQKLEIPFQLINESHNQTGNFFTLENPEENIVNHVHFDFGQKNFDWKVTLEGSQDQLNWFTIRENYRMVSVRNSHTDYRFTDIHFPDSRYRYLRLFIPGNDNPNLLNAHLTKKEENNGTYNTIAIKSMQVSENNENKQTIADIELAAFVPVSGLKIFIADTMDYYRQIRISYLSDSIKTPKGWKFMYRDLLTATLSSLEEKEFQFDHPPAKKLRIVISNHDNTPLEIKEVVVKSAVHEIIARFTEPATYYLAYGHDRPESPNYDITNFTENIPSELTALTLLSEENIPQLAAPAVVPLFQNKAWLWGIMVFIILVLGGFTFKMIRK